MNLPGDWPNAGDCRCQGAQPRVTWRYAELLVGAGPINGTGGHEQDDRRINGAIRPGQPLSRPGGTHVLGFILLFGAKKLPEAARGVGRSLRILKSEVSAMHEDDEKAKQTSGETDATASMATFICVA